MDAEAALSAFVSGRLADWPGLPALSTAELQSLYGPPVDRRQVTLGAYPAWRLELAPTEEGRTLAAYERGGEIVLVEVEPPPGLSALAGLPEPTAILPQEIDVEGAYAHEYLYGERGLMVTVAQRLDRSAPDQIVRCRGIRPLPPSGRPGAELYMPLDTQIKW